MTSETQDTYQPGTVAVATVRGVPGVRVFFDTLGYWHSETRVHEWSEHRGAAHVTDIRPLVVLDLGTHADTPRYVVADLRWAHKKTHNARLQEIADQIEAQTKPPRIPEPGLWGVVKAGAPNGGVYHFTRFPCGGWTNHYGTTFEWSDLIDPTLIREGVQS